MPTNQNQSNQNTQTSQNLKNLSDQELATKYKNTQDKQYFNEMMRRSQSAITSGLRSWGGNNPSLLVRAKIIAADAIKRYDPEKAQKTTLKTWVSNYMPKLSRYRDARTVTLHVPESVKRDAQYLSKLKDQHIEQYGQIPSAGWLKDRAGMSKKRFEKAYASFSESGEQRTFLGEAFGINSDDDAYKSWVDAVYSDLDEPDRKIFEGVSGYLGSPKKQKQQIAKELGMSNAAITNRLKNIQKQLEEFKEEK